MVVTIRQLTLLLIVGAIFLTQSIDAFVIRAGKVAVTNNKPSTQLYFFGGPKDDGSPGDYVCLVRFR